MKALLSGGDLRSDGLADQAADLVLEQPQLLPSLVEELTDDDEIVRGRAAHALEKISRQQPSWLLPHMQLLEEAAQIDSVAMVRWHLAMVFGNMAALGDQVDRLMAILLVLLEDRAAIVRSWAISGLTVIAFFYPPERQAIVEHIQPLEGDSSIAVRTRAQKALLTLQTGGRKLPTGWLKSQRL